jgi:uncharacterized protein (TIGR02391 family)
MSRPASSPPPKGPTLTPDQARSQLEVALEKGRSLLKQNPFTEERYKVWSENTWTVLVAAFGENSGHLNNFRGPVRVTTAGMPRHSAGAEIRENLERRIRLLEAVIDDLPSTSQATTTIVQVDDFWSRLHPSVVRASRSRFETSHYADAVESAFKDLNSKIKEHVRKATGQEFDGADLMNRAFSPNTPIVRLADLSTKDGENIQKGYLQIFSGAMTGIRNPKAHSNVTIDANRAIHHLHLASLLHQIFDHRL